MVDLTNTDIVQKIEQTLEYVFQDKTLLVEAFTHSSAADDRLSSNERLEFLGDSVLGLVICDALFCRFDTYLEGDLTKLKSSLVSRSTCANITQALSLQAFLCVGKGMSHTRALPKSIEAGLLEAVIGAIYQDGGFEKAQAFILKSYADLLDRIEVKGPNGNYKSLLQQYAQEHHSVTPDYILLDEKGPDHNKCFECEVLLQDRNFPSAWGVTKKEAEQRAAYNALVELSVIKKKKASER
ncbi:MAG: ribonuclease III [Phycisphaerae bacterium]|nr:ribonuclease III [Phycisphaerae bacterium]